MTAPAAKTATAAFAAALLLSGCAGFAANTPPPAPDSSTVSAPSCDGLAPGMDAAVCNARGLKAVWTKAAADAAAEDYAKLHAFPLGEWWMWVWACLGVIALGIVGGARERRDGDAAAAAAGSHADARIASLEGRIGRLAGVLIAGIGTVTLAWHLGGPGVGIAVAVPVVIGILIALARGQQHENAIAGHRLAAEQWRADQAAQQPIPVPDPHADLRDLDISLPPPPGPIIPTIPEPRLTDEEAAALAAHHTETRGWAPPAGSAIAAVSSVDGKITPAREAVATVARELGWGRWETGDDGTRVWVAWVECAGVRRTGDDAVVQLDVHHSSITEDTLEKALPPILRALHVRHGQLSRAVERGGYDLTVTNSREGFADPESASDTWDPEGW